MKKLLSSTLLLPTLTFAQAYELEPIFHTSKQEVEEKTITSSTYTLTQEKLENSGNGRVTDVIKKIPGVEISQTGLVGGEASVFIRGAAGRHTLILVDGVKVFDPTSIGRTLNLAILNSLDIEKVEVLKGSQSVLYGSDAIGGVINIITKKTSKNKVSLSTGIVDEINVENSVSIGAGVVYLSGFYQESKHLTEAKDGDEKDFNNSRGASLNHTTSKGKFDFNTILKFTDTFAEVDGFSSGKVVDDETAYGKDVHYYINERVTYNKSDKHKINFDLSYNKYNRKNKYTGFSGITTDQYNGSVLEAEVRSNKKKESGSLLVGLNTIKETYQDDDISEKTLNIIDVFFNRVFERNNNSLELGARNTNNDDFGSHLVYNLGYKKNISKHTSVKISNKTGFKAPSVYQQQAPPTNFGPIGNEDLAPEKSINYEVAFDYQASKKYAGIAIFYNEVTDYIDYDNGYNNIANLVSRGVELSAGKSFDKLDIGSNLTMINFSKSQGREIQRRPNFSLNTNLSYRFNDRHSTNLDWKWKGRRFEYSGASKIEMHPYDVLDLDYIYSRDSIKLVSSVNNVFNRDYEAVRGYETLGTSLQLTLKYTY